MNGQVWYSVLTVATAVVILVPPDAPDTCITFPLPSTQMVGVIDDMGLLPGSIKLDSDGGTPKALSAPG